MNIARMVDSSPVGGREYFSADKGSAGGAPRRPGSARPRGISRTSASPGWPWSMADSQAIAEVSLAASALARATLFWGFQGDRERAGRCAELAALVAELEDELQPGE